MSKTKNNSNKNSFTVTIPKPAMIRVFIKDVISAFMSAISGSADTLYGQLHPWRQKFTTPGAKVMWAVACVTCLLSGMLVHPAFFVLWLLMATAYMSADGVFYGVIGLLAIPLAITRVVLHKLQNRKNKNKNKNTTTTKKTEEEVYW